MRIATFYPTALTFLVLAGSVSGNLIYNGDFELGNTGFTTQYTYTADLSAPRTIVVGVNPSFYNPIFSSYGDHPSGFGRMLIANGATQDNVTVWEQTVSVLPNTRYVFFYWLSNCTDDDVRLAELKCLINGVQVGIGFAQATAGEWNFVFHRWNSGASSEAKIRLVNRNRAEVSNDFAIDDIGMIDIGDNVFLVASSTPGGRILSPGEGVFIYPPGEVVYLEAKCEPGYEFAGWGGNFGSHDHMLWAEMNTDYLAMARFKKLDYGVTIEASSLAPNEFATCSESAEKLSVLSGALKSGYPHGLVLGQTMDLCDATYRFPIFKPPGGIREITKIVVNVYGTTSSVGPVVRIGDSEPARPLNGDLHESFTASKAAALLDEDSEGSVYWLPVTVDAIMGVWDLAGVYVSYECPSVPPALLRRFHDHFSIQQALDRYARDPGLRDLYALRANDAHIWEAVAQTVALTEDLAGDSSALESAVVAGVDALTRLLGRWQLLLDAPDLAPLAACNTAAIPDSLDKAAASGQSYLAAYADAIADGRVTPDEAGDLNQGMAQWKLDLVALESALAESFDKLASVHRKAKTSKEQALRDTAEKMIRAMTPWYTGEPDDLGFWVPSSPTYLGQVIQSLEDFPAEQISVP